MSYRILAPCLGASLIGGMLVQMTNELEVASFGEVDGHAVTVRYPLKPARRVPLGISAYVRLGDWLLTPSEARGLAALLVPAADEAQRQPSLRPDVLYRSFDDVVESSR